MRLNMKLKIRLKSGENFVFPEFLSSHMCVHKCVQSAWYELFRLFSSCLLTQTDTISDL